ncbi:MAG: hypothetical protein NE330_04315 [Lentisphaeraceae bacterium]|nr:hypothetical protein [Lentisphaeraceae bacterium]
MPQVIDIREELNAWTETANTLLKAISERNYRLYRRCCSKGGQHFNVVKTYLDEFEVTDAELKGEILLTVDLWMSTIDGLKVWQGEIGTELETVKTKRRKKNKISSKYNKHVQTTGRNLRRKAK